VGKQWVNPEFKANCLVLKKLCSQERLLLVLLYNGYQLYLFYFSQSLLKIESSANVFTLCGRL